MRSNPLKASGISQVHDTFRSAASSHLSEIYQTTQALADHGAREDMPTGTTPRKRTWTFTDEWTLTQSREVLLQDWKRRRSTSAQPEELPSRHSTPVHEEPVHEEVEAIVTASEDGTDALSEADDQDETIMLASPPPTVKSLESSVSSSSASSSSTLPVAAPPPPPKEIKKPLGRLKSGLPVTRGTLTERPANVLAGRLTRRTRT